jgi:sporulation protein YlmC with PRC-barrel domain
MDIALDAHVDCTDGRIGRLENVILNPVSGKVTHLVVWKTDLPNTNTRKLAPEHRIQDSSHDTIQLTITRAQFDELPDFIHAELFSALEVLQMATLVNAHPSVPPTSVIVQTEAVPGGEVAVRKGTKVHASDGHVGRVDDFLIEKKDGRITHVVLREGHLWGKRDIAVPASQVDRYEDDCLHLKLDRKTIEQLPSFDVG